MDAPRRIEVAGLAWAAGLIPLLVVHACYLISASADLVPWCFPYVDGCTSISRAARYGAANHLFKAVMLPYSVLLMAYWWLAAEWLRGFSPHAPRRRQILFVLGEIAALFLILYVTFLGVEGDTYQWLRRYGTTVHFSFTVLAQILLMSVLVRDPRLSGLIRLGKFWLCALMLSLGLLSLVLPLFVADPDAAHNAIEWSYWLLMIGYCPLTGLAWRATRFSLHAQQDA